MVLCVKMTLLSDTIFGNGISVPGGEDSSVQTDVFGFPYYKAGTFKGIFREELTNYINWIGEESKISISDKLGESGEDEDKPDKFRFHDFELSENVKSQVLAETKDPDEILDACTYERTFTKINGDGIVDAGSLRQYRCVRKGMTFYSTISCLEEDEELLKNVLPLIKWVGTMRNRGFGHARVECIKE